MKRKLRLVGLGLVAGGLGAFLLGELYLRTYPNSAQPSARRSRSVEYTASLFARQSIRKRPRVIRGWRDVSGRVVISRLGYRGDPWPLKKPEGRLRVIVLGGSAVFDPHSPYGQDWPALVERRLRSAGVDSARVLNAGTPGHASWDAFGRLYSELWLHEPDVIVVYAAWNDIKYFRWLSRDSSLLRGYRPKPFRGTRTYLVDNPYLYPRNWLDRLLSHSEFYARLRQRWYAATREGGGVEGFLRGRARGEAPVPDSYSNEVRPPALRQYELTLRLIVEAGREAGADVLLATQGRLPVKGLDADEREPVRYDLVRLSHGRLVQAFAATDSLVRLVAETEDVPVVPVSREVSGQPEYLLDHVHLSEAGGRVVAGLVSRCIRRVLDGAERCESVRRTGSAAVGRSGSRE